MSENPTALVIGNMMPTHLGTKLRHLFDLLLSSSFSENYSEFYFCCWFIWLLNF